MNSAPLVCVRSSGSNVVQCHEHDHEAAQDVDGMQARQFPGMRQHG
jgi:hypothetical protein